MTIEERKLSIALQLANNANTLMIAELAQTLEENEQLKAKIEQLEKPAQSS